MFAVHMQHFAKTVLPCRNLHVTLKVWQFIVICAFCNVRNSLQWIWTGMEISAVTLKLDWLCQWAETYVSEPRLSTGVLFTPRAIRERRDPWWWWWYDDDDASWGTLTRPRERSGSPTSSHLGASRRSERRSENVAYSVSEIPQEILNMQ